MFDEKNISLMAANIMPCMTELDYLDSEEHLVDFMKHGWHTLEPGQPLEVGWQTEAICDHLEAVTNGDIRFLLMNVPPGPVHYESKVSTLRGPISIKDIKIGDYVLTHKGRYREVTDVLHQGVLPILQIETHSGRSVKVAPTHPMLTPNGWIEAGKLNVGDTLACVLSQEKRNTKNFCTPEEARFYGYLVGDGTVTQANPCFHNGDWDAIQDFIYCAESIGFKTTLRPRRTHWYVRVLGGKKVRDYLEKVGLQGKSSYEKRIPEIVLKSSDKIIKNFIGAYWTCDGSIDVRSTRVRGSKYRSFCASVNEKLIDDIIWALATIGIFARKRKRISNRITKKQPDGKYVSWNAEIQREEDAAKFANMPGLCLRKNKLALEMKKSFPKTLIDDEIIDIQLLSKGEKCLCLSVKEDNSFVISNIAVKNSTKSMTTSVFWHMWEWGPKKLPHHRFIKTSYAQGLSVRDNMRARDLMKSEWYSSRWPIEMKPDKDGKIEYENMKTGWSLAASSGSQLTGFRGDRIIVDDPHSVQAAESDKKRESVLYWFSETLPTRFNNMNKSAIIVIMQRLHENDVSGLILAKELGYEHLMIPMEFEPVRRCYSSVKPSYMPTKRKRVRYNEKEHAWQDEATATKWVIDRNTKEEDGVKLPPDDSLVNKILETWKTDMRYNVDPRTKEDELMHPARFDREAVERLKTALSAVGGSYAIAGQLQQRPVPRGGGMFKREDFKYLDKVPEGPITWCRGWDLAASDGSDSPYTVGVRMGKDTSGRYIIADVKRGKWTPGDMEQNILETTEEDDENIKRQLLQSIPQDPGQAGKVQKKAFAALLAGYNFRFSPESGSKEDRARPLSAQAEAGNLYLVRGVWNDDFVTEATSFPNGTFKDQVDAASRAFGELVSKKTGSARAGMPAILIGRS